VSEREQLICRLTYRSGDHEESIAVGDEPLTIGRSPESGLLLADESVSRSHARITRDGEGWVISDLGSKNGVKVNTYRTNQHRLASGDRIDLGAVRLYVGIRPVSPTSEAKVVFQAEEERGLRTEIIDMDRLGSLLGSAADSAPSSVSADVIARVQRDGAAVPESAELLLLSQAAETLISCETLDETLERILALVFDNLTAERGVICLYDEETDTTEPKVMRTQEGVPNEPISISSNIVNDVIKRRQSLLVQDTRRDERYGDADSVIMMNIKSAMCAPLYRQGRIVGFIYVDRQSGKHPFTATHLQALSTLAILSAVAVEQTALRDGLRHERDMRARLARYSSPAVVDRIVKAPGAAQPGMVVDEGEVTVLFADLTGFTAMAEKFDPPEVVLLLNSVFERLTDVIFEFDGTLDKFRGDGMMAFFGAPLPLADHAERAVRAAVRMQELLADVNSYTEPGRRVDMRIGINSGPVVVGDIGSPQRKDYTVIGDAVNIASRLESSVAKPGQVVIGPSTYDQLGPPFQCRALEETSLKGKRLTVRPYLVVGIDDPPDPGLAP
jgi:adenylate cyclase